MMAKIAIIITIKGDMIMETGGMNIQIIIMGENMTAKIECNMLITKIGNGMNILQETMVGTIIEMMEDTTIGRGGESHRIPDFRIKRTRK
jgi:hypothetical protein